MMHTCYHKKTILITGASGYIGTHLIQKLINIDCHIIRFSRKPLLPIVGKAKITDIQGDLQTFDDWKDALKNVDYIFHLAAQTGVAEADKNPVDDALQNVIGSLRILTAAREQGDIIFMMAGAATECGLTSTPTVSETIRDNPETLYDLNKLHVENYLKYFCKKKWIKGTCLRLANVYGPGVKSSNSSRGILNHVIRTAISGQDVYTFDGGMFIRDYVYLDDVIHAFLLAGQQIEKLNGSHYVIGSGVGTTLKDAFSKVIDLVKEKTNATPILKNTNTNNGAAIDKRDFIADISAFHTATGWKPATPLNNGIAKTVDAFLRSP